MLRKLHFALGLIAALAVGGALRCPLLGVRPMHNDEAVNGIKFGQLWQHGSYTYDPQEHHGPTLHYATYLLEKLTRAPSFDRFTEGRLRFVTVFFGLGMIVLLALVADGLGSKGALWAALFTAVSPALVFYSRDYIHETLLVFFMFLVIAAGWRYWQSRRVVWALMLGIALGLLGATKETFVMNLAAAVGAAALALVWDRFVAAGSIWKARQPSNWHVGAIGGLWAVVTYTLFSSFFANPDGPLDAVRSYHLWFIRSGVGSPHIHPWYYYFHRLLWFHPGRGPVWTEALVLFLGLIGAYCGFSPARLAAANASFVRFLAFYTFLLTAAYTVVSYKTPWCLLGFWHGMILLAGVGAAAIVRGSGVRIAWGKETKGTEGTEGAGESHSARVVGRPAWRRGITTFLLLAGTAHLAWQAWLTAVPFSADRRNPYVYAQTSPSLLELVQQVEALTAASPQGRDMPIKVIAPDDDYWPLPWYLRNFNRVGWYSAVPANPIASVMIVSSSPQTHIPETPDCAVRGIYELRPEVFLELYVDHELWTRYVGAHK